MNPIHELLCHIPERATFDGTAAEIAHRAWPYIHDAMRVRLAAGGLRSLRRQGAVQQMVCVGQTVYWLNARGRELRRRVLEVSHGA